MDSEETCGSEHKIYGIGECRCTLRPGHAGVHEDEPVGVWWPGNDQLENW